MIDLQADLKTLLASPAVAPWRRALRLRLSERRLLLLCIDLAIVNVVLFLAVGFRTDLSVEAWLWPWNLKWFASLSAIWLVNAILFDLYDLARASDTEKTLLSTTGAVLTTTLLYVITPYVTPPLLSRGVLVFFLMAMMFGLLAWRMVYVRLFGRSWFMQRALIVGSGKVGQDIVNGLQNTDDKLGPYTRCRLPVGGHDRHTILFIIQGYSQGCGPCAGTGRPG